MDGHVKDLWHKGKGKSRQRTDRYGKGKRWQVRWTDEIGERKTRVFDNKDEADMFLAKASVGLAQGNFIDSAKSRHLTVNALIDTWLSTKAHLKPKSVEQYETTAKRIREQWGHRPLSSLRHSEIATWVAELRASGLSYSTVNHALRDFRSVLSLAIKDRLIHVNPAEGVSAGSATYRTKQFLTHEQVEALAQECVGFETVIRVLAITGIRFGEMAALRVADFDQVKRRLIITKSVTETRKRGMFIGTTKTGQEREVPLPKFLANEIAEGLMARTVSPEDVLFPDSKGGMIRNRNWVKRVFQPALERLGPEFPAISPHSLRHTAASLSIAAGADIKVIQQLLGHARASMTMDQYGHLYPNRLDEVAHALEFARSEKLKGNTEVTRGRK